MTLYISDLDGTLLNPAAEISAYTVAALNHLIKSGIHFSVATARTAATARYLLNKININVPVILMNGVCIYDLQTNKYIKVAAIDQYAKIKMINIISEYRLAGFLYTIDREQLFTFYENADHPAAQKFIVERVEKYGKVFDKVDRFVQCADRNFIYYSISDARDTLLPALSAFRADPRFNVEFYRDIYNKDHWYLEVCSSGASKYSAAIDLKNSCKFEKIISFGDNLNDLPLFRASDAGYAVANARPEVKAAAKAVIGSNSEDGVARWLLENAQF